MVVITPDGTALNAAGVRKKAAGSVIHDQGIYGDGGDGEEGSKETGRPLTKEYLKGLSRSDRRMYYSTPHLNDKLYIHYGGFTQLSNLEEWTGLRVIYADCNAISKIEGLDTLVEMRSLHLNQNCIRKLEGLDNLKELWTLSLTENYIQKIENLSHLPRLNTLSIDKNHVGSNGLDDIIHLKDTTINTLDLKDNKIDDPDCLEEVFMKMKELRVLYLKGNPVVKKIPNYRKTFIAKMPNLRYLDDRPVFPEDSRYANAFMRGGIAEERLERQKVRQEKEDEHKRNMDAFRTMVDNAKREGRERRGMQAEDRYTDETDPVAVARREMMHAARQEAEEYDEDGDLLAPLNDANLRNLDINTDDRDADSIQSTRTPQSRRSGQTRMTATSAADGNSAPGTSAPNTAPGSEADPKSNAQSEADAQSEHGDKKVSAVPALDEDAMIPSRDNIREARPVKYDDIWGDDEDKGAGSSGDKPFLPWMDGSADMPPADPEVMQKKMEAMLDQLGAAKGKGKGWYKEMMQSDEMQDMVGKFFQEKEKQAAGQEADGGADKSVRLPIVEEDDGEDEPSAPAGAEKPTRMAIEEDDMEELD